MRACTNRFPAAFLNDLRRWPTRLHTCSTPYSSSFAQLLQHLLSVLPDSYAEPLYLYLHYIHSHTLLIHILILLQALYLVLASKVGAQHEYESQCTYKYKYKFK